MLRQQSHCCKPVLSAALIYYACLLLHLEINQSEYFENNIRNLKFMLRKNAQKLIYYACLLQLEINQSEYFENNIRNLKFMLRKNAEKLRKAPEENV